MHAQTATAMSHKKLTLMIISQDSTQGVKAKLETQFAPAPDGYQVSKSRFSSASSESVETAPQALDPWYIANKRGAFSSSPENDDLKALEESRTIQKYYLQTVASRLLWKHDVDPAKPLNHQERVCKCHRVILPVKSGVDVMHAPDENYAFLRNLETCGSVWSCPVCSAKITERRRQELAQIVAASGLLPVLITYTLSHQAGDPLADLYAAIAKAFGNVKRNRQFNNAKKDWGWVCSARSIEVTYGVNGWHPHIHQLALLDLGETGALWRQAASGQLESHPDGDLLKNAQKNALNHLQAVMREVYLHELGRLGYSASWERGLDLVSERADIAAYVAKYGHEPVDCGWTLTHEVAKGASKVGNLNGRTPFQLLADYANGDRQAGALYCEYHYTMKRKQQLRFEDNMRERFDLEALSDSEIANAEPEEAVLLARITYWQWQAIRNANKELLKAGRKRDLRGELLDLAAAGDAAAVDKFVSDVENGKLLDALRD